jgi:hypothetical protein
LSIYAVGALNSLFRENLAKKGRLDSKLSSKKLSTELWQKQHLQKKLFQNFSMQRNYLEKWFSTSVPRGTLYYPEKLHEYNQFPKLTSICYYFVA